MHDESSRFLDRIQEDAGIHERGRALSGVRAVFYALFSSLQKERGGGLAETLPPELESLWKPAYFQCLRDGLNGAPAEASVEEALRRVQRLTPTVDSDEASRLLGAVIRRLRDDLGPETWGRVEDRLPGDLRAADAPSGIAEEPVD